MVLIIVNILVLTSLLYLKGFHIGRSFFYRDYRKHYDVKTHQVLFEDKNSSLVKYDNKIVSFRFIKKGPFTKIDNYNDGSFLEELFLYQNDALYLSPYYMSNGYFDADPQFVLYSNDTSQIFEYDYHDKILVRSDNPELEFKFFSFDEPDKYIVFDTEIHHLGSNLYYYVFDLGSQNLNEENLYQFSYKVYSDGKRIYPDFAPTIKIQNLKLYNKTYDIAEFEDFTYKIPSKRALSNIDGTYEDIKIDKSELIMSYETITQPYLPIGNTSTITSGFYKYNNNYYFSMDLRDENSGYQIMDKEGFEHFFNLFVKELEGEQCE